MHIKEKVYKLRSDRGWSQTELANKSGVGRGTINKIENDPDYKTSFNTLYSLANTLGVDVEFLQEDKEDDYKKLIRHDILIADSEDDLDKMIQMRNTIDMLKDENQELRDLVISLNLKIAKLEK